MRSLHVFDHSLPHGSGYVYRSLGILDAQAAAGIETCMLTGPRQHSGETLVERVDGRLFFRTPDAPESGPPLVREVRRLARLRRRLDTVVQTLRPDIVHVHSPVLNALPLLRLLGRYRLPWVYEMRATWEDAAVSHGQASYMGPRYRVSRALETHVLRRADHVVTICDGLAREIAARGVPAERVSVVRNFIRGSGRTPPAVGPAAQAAPAYRIGYIGSLYGYEGLETLIDLATHPFVVENGIQITVIGGGPEEARLRELCASRGVADRVAFVGRVSNAQVRDWYRAFDLLVLPRKSIRLTELTTPLKPIEAMTHGCVVVASDIGGHREMVRDAETGYLFAAGDTDALAGTLARAYRARGDWPRIRLQAAQLVAAEFSETRASEIYADVYRRLVPAPAGRPASAVVPASTAGAAAAKPPS